MILTEAAFRACVQASSSFKFDQISKYAENCQNGILRQIFGKALLDELEAAPDPKDSDAELIAFIQEACANFALAKALPKLIVTLTGSGALQAENNSKKPLYEWQKIELENELLESGWMAIEYALEVLEANRDTYTTWTESPDSNWFYNSAFLYAAEFNNHFQISSSRRTLEALKGCINDVVNLTIKPLLGENYDTFLSARKDGSLTPDGDANIYAISHLIYPTVANLAIEQALFKMEFTFTDEGVRVTSVSASSEKAKIKSLASMDMKREMAARCSQTGAAYLSKLKTKAIELSLIADNSVSIDNSTGSTFIF